MPQFIVTLLDSIRISDIFDIGVITVMSYVVLIWFKKTASRFVLMGIIILGIIYTVARFFHMYLTEYVLQGFFAILLIAMIVIFQEDLRRFFERLATWGVMPKKKSHFPLQDEVALITKATTALARRRRGALIVLRGRDHLERHLDGGITLQGKISGPLLESIFDPHSVGHDGAVILEDGEVTQFAARLPLSTNTREIGLLGLRHTAALGLTERSDALCIIVSEERGTISIAEGGTIHTLLGSEQLPPMLEDFFQKRGTRSRERSWFRKITENPWEKGIALVLACSLWAVFGYQTETIRRDFVIPIVYRNLPADWIIEEQKPKDATVTLMGPEQAFGLLNKETLKIAVDITAISEGKQTVVLQRNHVQHPSNLSVVGMRPAQISLVAHHLVQRQAAVQVQTTGVLPAGVKLDHIESDPAEIPVMTLEKNTEEIRLMTAPVPLDTIDKDTTVTTDIILPPDIQFVDEPVSVRVHIDVKTPDEETQKGREKTTEETPKKGRQS